VGLHALGVLGVCATTVGVRARSRLEWHEASDAPWGAGDPTACVVARWCEACALRAEQSGFEDARRRRQPSAANGTAPLNTIP